MLKMFWIIGAWNFEIQNYEIENKIEIWISTFLVELHQDDVLKVLLVVGLKFIYFLQNRIDNSFSE